MSAVTPGTRFAGGAALITGLVLCYVVGGWLGAPWRGVFIGFAVGVFGPYAAQNLAGDKGLLHRIGLIAAFGALCGLAAVAGGGFS